MFWGPHRLETIYRLYRDYIKLLKRSMICDLILQFTLLYIIFVAPSSHVIVCNEKEKKYYSLFFSFYAWEFFIASRFSQTRSANLDGCHALYHNAHLCGKKLEFLGVVSSHPLKKISCQSVSWEIDKGKK